jgi:hypothetical protein
MREIFKSIVWDLALEVELAALFLWAPFLSVWPLRQVISGVAKMLSDKFFNALTLFVDVTDIKLKNKEHHEAYVRESVKLAVVLHEKGINSDEYKTQREASKLTMSRFTRFSGVQGNRDS